MNAWNPASTARSAVAAVAALVCTVALAQVPLADGEVRKVDKENRKITLKHGEIKNIDMPPMTMVFGVKDAALLDKVKPGDKVRFQAVSEGGQIVVTEIQPVK